MFFCLCDRCNTFINIRRKVLLSSVGFRKRMTSHSPRGSSCDSCQLRFDRPAPSSTLIFLMIWRLFRGLVLLFRSSLDWFNQEDATASVWKWCFNVSPRSSLLANREGPFSGCYSVTSLEWPRMEWHSIGPEQSMKSIIDCHRLIFRSSIVQVLHSRRITQTSQKKIKWTAAPSNNFFKILAGIIENCPYGNVCLCRIIMNACNNNNNNTLFQYPTLIYMIQKIDINTEWVQGAHNNHIED